MSSKSSRPLVGQGVGWTKTVPHAIKERHCHKEGRLNLPHFYLRKYAATHEKKPPVKTPTKYALMGSGSHEPLGFLCDKAVTSRD
jgi:hypothetical protein